MHLKPYFSNSIRQLGYELDPQQALAVESLDELFQVLAAPPDSRKHLPGETLRHWLFRGKHPRSVPEMVKGRYLWGGVGRGKTWIMDLFYHSLPMDTKLRQHYQHFMRMIHSELTLLKGNRDPLSIIARQLAGRYRVICLDEFHVNDITDAMLLHGLLASLFEQGLVLVVTSNQHPDELYRNGLQRERFLPAIELIKQNTEQVEFGGTQDYRQRPLQQASTFFMPNDENNRHQFRVLFQRLAGEFVKEADTLPVNQRQIAVLAVTEDVAMFDFHELCATARSASDYIEIANRFHTVFIEGVPVMSDNHDDQARRFVHLVDEFYDRKIRLFLCAEAPVKSLYSGRRLNIEFERTVSRLLEMRTQEYQERSRAAQAGSGQSNVQYNAGENSSESNSDDRTGGRDELAFDPR